MFNNPFLNTIFLGAIAYIAIIFILRVSGEGLTPPSKGGACTPRKRTLTKWNSFDFVVTIAFGSILSSILTSTKDTFGTGLLAFTLLVFCQYIISWITARSTVFQKLIKAKPSLLLYQGQLKHDVLKKERVAEGEVLAALRASGLGAIEEADAVVLETDGSLSVIKELGNSTASALKDVKEFNRSSLNNSF